MDSNERLVVDYLAASFYKPTRQETHQQACLMVLPLLDQSIGVSRDRVIQPWPHRTQRASSGSFEEAAEARRV